jgi:competence protein ComEC
MTRRARAVLAGLVFAAAGAAAQDPNTMRAHFINVGQGDATLLEFSCGVVMIDAGGQGSRDTSALVAYLQNFFAGRPELHDTIRAVFITHNHVDHTRGLRAVIRHFHVQRLIENGQRGKNPAHDPGDQALLAGKNAPGHPTNWIDLDESEIAQTEEGLTGSDIDPVSCSGTDPEIRVLSADYADNPGWTAGTFNDKNNHSLVIRVDFGHASFLFTGDLETEAIGTLLQNYANSAVLDVDVWHVGHHGSYNGTTSALLARIVHPEIAVISMGSCEDTGQWTARAYGHPRKPAIDELKWAITRHRPARRVYVATAVNNFYATTMRDAIYATGWDGTIVIRAGADGSYVVTTEAPPVPAC